MGLFKKISRGANRFFNKVGRDATNFGNKVVSAGKDVSSGLSTGLNTVSNVAGVLAKNSIVNSLTGGQGNEILGKISDVAKQGANTVNYKNYHGGVNQVSNQLQKNIQGIKDAGGGIFEG
jgi:hypothetical protein